VAVSIKDPYVQKAALTGLGMAGLLFLFFGTSLVPVCYKARAAKAQDLRDEVARLEADVGRARATVSGLESLETEYASLEREWAEAQALLPEKSQVPEFLTGVTRAALDCGLDVLMFEPKKIERQDFYTVCRVAMKVAGQYHHAGELLAHVANQTRLVNVDKLQLRRPAVLEGEEDQTVEMEVLLSAYYLEDDVPRPKSTGPEPGAKTPAAKGGAEPSTERGDKS
jgi:Tfp pilus assembly protein PilO